jgi:hypothetical protein
MRAFEKALKHEREEFHPTLTTAQVGSVYMSTEGNVLVFRNRGFSPHAVMVREALMKLQLPNPDQQRVLDRFKEAGLVTEEGKE